MAAILNVRATVRRYRLPPAFADELIKLFDEHVTEIHSRTRVSRSVLSVKTQERRATALCKAFVELRKGGFALQGPWSLKEKHIRWLVERWVAQGQSGGTIENKLTYLRAMAHWLGKKNLVGTIGDYVDRKEHGLERSYIATEDKSWAAHGISASEKIAEIAKTCAHVAVQLKLQAAFGLRREESFLFRPLEAVRNPDRLRITRGTKGGRERDVPLDAKFAILEEAARLSNGFTGSTIPESYTLVQWVDRYKTVLKKHGVTKKGLGVTGHGLRHQYLQELYESVTGTAAPIKGSGSRPEPGLHEEAMKRVVEAAGHSRVTKANAYLSTFALQERISRHRPTGEEIGRALEEAGGNKSHAASALGISRQALYRALGASKAQ
ncbi:integrase domain-containing protein [Paraburkholderia phenazinium]|uniref:integrase domain-containing protein n=2 Tax=Burkholderiaceae TaxID=119060 RepID=UPI00158EC73C|nr:integrase domain-containing protein [Paraburkholderia phenazinium]